MSLVDACRMDAALTAMMAIEARWMRKGLNSWRDISIADKRNERLILNGVMALTGSALKRAVTTWELYACERATSLRRLRYVAATLCSRRVRHTFSSWYASTNHDSRKMQDMGSAARTIIHRGRRAGFNSWRSYMREAWEHARQVSESCATMQRTIYHRAWRAWVPTSQRWRTLKDSLRAFTARERRLGFDAWCGYSQSRAHNTQAMRSALASLYSGATQRALNGWRHATRGRSSKLGRLQLSINSFRSRTLRLALNTWHDGALARQGAHASILHASQGILEGKIAKAMRTWKGLWDKKMGVKRAAAAAFLQRLVRIAINSWIEEVHLRRSGRQQLLQAAQSLRSRHLVQGFNGWAVGSRVSGRKHSMTRRAACTMRNHWVRKGINSWISFWVITARQKRMVLSGISAIVNSDLKRALGAWTAYAIGHSSAHRRMLHVTRALHADIRRRSINSWMAYARDRVGWVQQAGWALRAIRHHGKLRGFESWRVLAREAPQRVLQMRVSAGRMRASRWRTPATVPRPHSHPHPYHPHPPPPPPSPPSHPHPASIPAARLLWHRYNRAWCTWAPKAAVRRKLSDGLRSFTTRLRRLGLSSWRELCASRHSKVQMLYASLASFKSVTMRQAMVAWVHANRSQGSQAHSLQRYVRAFALRTCRRSMNTWQECSRAQAVAGSRMQGALRALKQRAEHRAIRGWRGNVTQAASRTRRLHYSMLAWQRRGYLRAWLQWRQVLALRRKLHRTLSGHVGRHLHAGLRTWREGTRVTCHACVGCRTRSYAGLWTWREGAPGHAPITAHRSPLTAHCSPHRSPLTARRSPLAARPSHFTLHTSTSTLPSTLTSTVHLHSHPHLSLPTPHISPSPSPSPSPSLKRQLAKVPGSAPVSDAPLGLNLKGTTVGVLGTGRIGYLFAMIMQKLGCEVIAYDPYRNAAIEAAGIPYLTVEEIYARADVISLHVPLLPTTEHMINEEVVSQKLRPGAILLNVSRGGLIDTEAVVKGLAAGQLGGYGSDVYEYEAPYFFDDHSKDDAKDALLSSLLACPTAQITGHQAFLTNEALSQIVLTTTTNLHQFLRGEELKNQVKA